MLRFEYLEISQYYNNIGTTYKEKYNDGDFTGFGSSFPSEDLPQDNSVIEVNKVPFLFPSKNVPNNFDLFNQILKIPSMKYKGLHILGSSENGSFQGKVTFNGRSIIQTKRFGLTDFVKGNPEFGEKVAFKCNGLHSQNAGYLPNIKPIIWHQYIEIDTNQIISSLEFSDNACMHIFCLTLEGKE